MKRKNNFPIRRVIVGLGVISFVVVGILFFNTPSYSENNEKELLKKVEALQRRVEELESAQKSETHYDPLGYSNYRQANQWDPFVEMQQMQEAMNRMFQHSFSNRGWSNGGIFSNTLDFNNDFNIKETKEGYEISFDMAGMDNEKVDIQINEHSITVKGEHQTEKTKEDKDRYIKSHSFGSFMRTIPLPVDADTTNMKTEKEGERLVIKLHKKLT